MHQAAQRPPAPDLASLVGYARDLAAIALVYGASLASPASAGEAGCWAADGNPDCDVLKKENK